jgi:hypothetical protein
MQQRLTDRLSTHLPEDPLVLAEALYGASWRSSLVDHGSTSWGTRRLPPPLQVAPLLVPALDGLAAHDGRSTRDGRGAGWWLLDEDSGAWHEADTDAMGLEILPALQALTLWAQSDVRDAGQALRPIDRRRDRARHEAGSQALSDARLRAALLEALSALVASGSSGRWGSVAQALRSRLTLPTSALASIVLEALREAAEVEGWEEDSRLSPASLWEAVDEAGTALPRRTFLRALPTLLGEIRKVGGHRFYILPDLDDVEVR